MIKLFAADLDGTLLGAMHQVSEPVRHAVREARREGAHFSVATGRTLRTPDDFGFDGLGNDVVAANGAIVMTCEGELIRFEQIDPALVEEMLLAFPNAVFTCVGRKGTYVTGTREEHDAGFRDRKGLKRAITAVRMRAMKQGDSFEKEFRFEQAPADVLADDICKINCRTNDAGIVTEFGAFLAEHTDKLVNAPFDPSMFEVTRTGVNKGAAVARLAEHYGFGPDEVQVYGDGGNDIDMLSRFSGHGHAFAPRGACDAAKTAASATIGSNVLYAVPRHVTKTLRSQRQY